MARFGSVFKMCSKQMFPSSVTVVFNGVIYVRFSPDDPKWDSIFPSKLPDFRVSRFSHKCQKEEGDLEQDGQNIQQRLVESCTSTMKLRMDIDEMLNSGKMLDNASLFVLADAILKRGDDVEDALNQLISDFLKDLAPNIKSAMMLIEKFIHVNKLTAAYSLIRAMRARGIIPELTVYNSLLTAAAKESNFKLACQIFKELLTNGSSNFTYFTLSKAFAKTGDTEVAFKFCMELLEDSFHYSSTVVNRLIYAFAGTGQTKTALRLFEYMKRSKYKPNQVTYNIVIDVLGKLGQTDAAFHEFLAMKDMGHDPNIITYNTLIISFSRLGRLELCLMLLQEMAGRGIQPDLRTYTAIIDRFGRLGKVDDAMSLFDEMKQRGCEASIYVYKSLISNAKKAGNVELANKLLEEMKTQSSNLITSRDFKKKRR